ncbi:MAG: hypothetical protein IJM99_00500 [Firmicutes bacterium]|nr:hypothetical protein [Bacillota bacterium]
MSMGKKALMLGICGAALSAAVLWIEKKNREKKFEEELWEVEEDDDAEIEFTMTAGEVEAFEEEMEEESEELPQLEVVGVVLTGPRTARVRPTEEEEKERLREKLETMIRF